MRITCPHCNQAVVYEGKCPDLCEHCKRVLFADTDYREVETLVGAAQHESETGHVESDDTVGPYRLVRQLGQGGMGLVWEAEHQETGRRVALKLLSPRLAPTEETIERFIREGRLAASLSHPRSTFVFGAGQHEGQPFIVMELMPGRTLQDLMEEEGPLPINRAVDLILDVIDGLEAAHQLGVIHRDVKPSNCFLDSDGRVKVGDFGLSKSLVSDVRLTQTGAFMGTPQFAAPEQIRGTDVDERTDIYAVGATLYSLIANRGPFTGDAMAVIAQIVSDPPTPLREVCPSVPRSLDGIVSRTLEKDPQRRYADLALLRRALQPFATGGTSIADVWRRLAAYMLDILLVSVVGTVFVMFTQFILGAIAVSRGSSDSLVIGGGLGAFGLWQGVSQLGMILWQVGYFFVAEARWGRGVGKLLMGLRVVDDQGERPSWMRSLIRAFFIPGAAGLVAATPLYMLLHGSNGTLTQPNLSVRGFVVPTLIGFIPMAFLLLCLTTMRRRNGYRGLHELASGTRVVRLRSAASESEQSKIPRVVPISAEEEGASYGPFHVSGTLARSNGVTVYQATDELLQRSVWIYVGPKDDSSVVIQPRLVERPTRPHWLQGGATETMRWDAFEAVEGSPLPDVMEHGQNIDWRQARFWLRDLTDELAAALDDNTLPAQLTLDQVWVDRGGRVKLLDAPLQAIASDGRSMQSPTAAPPQQAVELLQSAVALCSQGQLLPTHTQRFIAELEQREAGKETLDWAAQQLHEIAERPVRLAWDNRLAVLAVSMGTEFSFYLLCAVGIPLLLWMLIGNSLGLWIALSLLLTQVSPSALGYFFRGGPVFRFTKVEVMRKNGLPASRLRCMVRNLFAWIPCIFPYSLLGLLTTQMLMSDETANFAATKPQQFVLLLVPICSAELLGLLFVVGAIYAVAKPQRGLQDLLAGTYLVPK